MIGAKTLNPSSSSTTSSSKGRVANLGDVFRDMLHTKICVIHLKCLGTCRSPSDIRRAATMMASDRPKDLLVVGMGTLG